VDEVTLVLRLLLPVLIPSTTPHSSSSIIRGWYNRPKSGGHAEWTQSHAMLLLSLWMEVWLHTLAVPVDGGGGGGFSFTPLSLCYSRKSPRYPLDKRLGGPQGRSGLYKEETKHFPKHKSNTNSLVVRSVAELLYRLEYSLYM
jgi:hypothetical protein